MPTVSPFRVVAVGGVVVVGLVGVFYATAALAHTGVSGAWMVAPFVGMVAAMAWAALTLDRRLRVGPAAAATVAVNVPDVAVNIAGTSVISLTTNHPHNPNMEELRAAIETHLHIPMMSADDQRLRFLTQRLALAFDRPNAPAGKEAACRSLAKTYLPEAWLRPAAVEVLATLRDGQRHTLVRTNEHATGAGVVIVLNARIGTPGPPEGRLLHEVDALTERHRQEFERERRSGPDAILVADIFCVDATATTPPTFTVFLSFFPLDSARLASPDRRILVHPVLLTEPEAARVVAWA